MFLPGPSQKLYLVEPGVLDERARLAFQSGQCHGLALALNHRLGWPLVAITDRAGVCLHICVRRPDSRLIDVTGAHTEQEFGDASPGCEITEIDDAAIEELVATSDWAVPNALAAEPWIEPVLEQAQETPALPPLRTARYRRTEVVEDDLAVRFTWDGEPNLLVEVQRPSVSSLWTRYSIVEFPVDPATGGLLIDFSIGFFETLTKNWLARGFSPQKAKAKICSATMP